MIHGAFKSLQNGYYTNKIYKQGNPDLLSSFTNIRFYPVMIKDTSTVTN